MRRRNNSQEKTAITNDLRHKHRNVAKIEDQIDGRRQKYLDELEQAKKAGRRLVEKAEHDIVVAYELLDVAMEIGDEAEIAMANTELDQKHLALIDAKREAEQLELAVKKPHVVARGEAEINNIREQIKPLTRDLDRVDYKRPEAVKPLTQNPFAAALKDVRNDLPAKKSARPANKK